MRALVVEDEPDARQLMRRVLKDEGHDVSDYERAEPAWNDFQANRHELAVIDWLLPGIDGLELCRRIRALVGDATSVLVITGRTGAEDLQQVLAAGADDYLDKPLSLERLRIRLAISERNARQTAKRRQTERALQESERLYRLLAEHSSDMVSLHCPSGRFRYVSPVCELLLGYKPDDLIGRDAYEFHHPDDRPIVERSHREILATSNIALVRYRFRRRDGDYVWLESTSKTIRDEAGEVTEIICVSRDITARKAAEYEVKRSHERWQSLMDNVPDYIAMIDRDCRIQFINRVLPQFKMEDVVGKTCFEFMPTEAHAQASSSVTKVFETGEPQHFEVQGLGPDNRWAWYVVRLGPVKQDGEIVAAVFVATDVTERVAATKALEAERELLKRMLEIQEREREVIAFEIHDGMVQSMTAALMHLEATLAHDQQIAPVAATELNRSIELQRRAIVEARLLISGLRPPILEEFGVIAAIETLIADARRSIPTVEFAYDESIERLAPQLESTIFRIVQEALTNASRHSRAQELRVTLRRQQDGVVLTIRDDGKGFDPAAVNNERFGLRGIRERARVLGGAAEITSAPQAGTQIHVELPLLELPQETS